MNRTDSGLIASNYINLEQSCYDFAQFRGRSSVISFLSLL
ncbi:hypothetical protein BACPLE_00071 [Phocaeicola plebeius DSM 17135]|uniref:Uncharacterized protein n=1 Tax=Phocaeicola plebeius (strain DSM 17135 / JCM 12973 / CCUG 54634 / M2) TaxID=484018 RepID=B5CTJ6_PHOPM|nr:hypothetical protein BACPLE_00071 [Phocaeicola plebeius DSM 17135]